MASARYTDGTPNPDPNDRTRAVLEPTVEIRIVDEMDIALVIFDDIKFVGAGAPTQIPVDVVSTLRTVDVEMNRAVLRGQRFPTQYVVLEVVGRFAEWQASWPY